MAKPAVSVEIKLEDVGKIRRQFAELSPGKQRAGMRSAATRGATAVRKTARRLVPVGLGLTPSGKKRPHLRDALVQSVKTLGKGNKARVSAIVGADYKKVPTIHLVDAGTKPHEIKARKRSLSNVSQVGKDNARFFGAKIKHPGSKAKPFLRNALEQNKTEINRLFVEAMHKALAKAAAKK